MGLGFEDDRPELCLSGSWNRDPGRAVSGYTPPWPADFGHACASKGVLRMAPRAFWTGNLRLSLVTIPVRLYPATSSERKIELHQIHEPTGKRIRYQKVAPGVGPVESEEIIKGYEYEKGKYVLLDQKEIDELKLESKQTIELVRFVEPSAI